MPEILMILAIALIVIGPKKLPDLAKTLGRAMGEFKRSAQDFKRSIDVETTVKEFKSGVDIPKADLSEILSNDSPLKDETEASDKDESDSKDQDEENPLENDDSGKTDNTSEQDKIDK